MRIKILNNIEYSQNNKNIKTWYNHGGYHHREDGPAIVHTNDINDWYQHGKRHRVDGPAKEWHGLNAWYQQGVLHRTNGPALEHADGTKEWWIEGERHRIEDPAILSSQKYGRQEYYHNGKRHRVGGGPAKEMKSRSGTHREWYVHGVLHRVDGPAVEWANGKKEYWFYGIKRS